MHITADTVAQVVGLSFVAQFKATLIRRLCAKSKIVK